MSTTLHSLIQKKLFRVRENQNKVNFILANSQITEDTLLKAAVVAKKNPYHNFGHELGATEYAIKLAKAEGRSDSEIYFLCLVMLFHDARHRGYVQLYDEMRAVEAADEVLDVSDTKFAHEDRSFVIQRMRNLILDTIFPDARGKNKDPLSRIVQDADLAHLGQGIPYWLWSSMGLIEEFNLNKQNPLTPETFIRSEQEKFIKFLTTLSGTGEVYLSEGAAKIFNDPMIDVQLVKKVDVRIIEYAYRVRYEDVTLSEFEQELNSIKQSIPA